MPGATSDLTLLRSNLEWHKRVSRKSLAAQEIVDHGEEVTRHPNLHAVMFDKGCIGIEGSLR